MGHDARVKSLPLSTVVQTSAAVAATRSRKDKTASLAAALVAAAPEEAALVVSLLAGDTRQGRIGVGWATLSRVTSEPAAQSSLSIDDVDTTLDTIAATTGEGSERARAVILSDLLARATKAEAEFLKRLLLGELRQGANEGLVIEGLAKASGIKAATVRRALMLSGQLGLVTTAAMTGGPAALEEIGLRLGRPMRPMLASTAADVGQALEALGESSVEWKLDGARIQVHRDHDGVRIWTRNLNEITSRLPAIVEIVAAFPAERLVLDGEVLGLAADDEEAAVAAASFQDTPTPLSFQDTMRQVGGSTRTAASLRPFFFDILHIDGTDLVDAPLRERRRQLVETCQDYAVAGIVTGDEAEAQAVLDAALSAGHEGVMVKAANSPYEAGRRGKTWRKIKPVHTLDLVVLAAEWGHGRRQGWLSNLHLGARGSDGEFVMVGKTFKGLTDALLAWQTDQFLARRTHESGITVHIRPELVVEIAVDGVQTSSRYPGEVALRFARVKQYRPDKGPDQADTIETVQAMR